MTKSSSPLRPIKDMVGKEFFVFENVIADKSSIARYAVSISDFNPLYFDENLAKKSKYGCIIAPPTYLFDVNHNIFSEIGEDGRDLGRVSIAGKTAVRGGNEYQFFEPVRAGDRISAKRKIVDMYEKKGKRSGTILFIITETTYVNADAVLLGICKETMMFVN